MKIGMFCDTFLPLIGGAEIHIIELSRSLRKLNQDVEIITTIDGDSTVDGFSVTRIPELAGGGREAVFHMPGTLPNLFRCVRKADLAHCHYSFLMAAVVVMIGKICRIPTVVTLHGLGTLDSSVGSSILRRFYRLISIKLADRVIATSDEIREVALRYTSKDKIVIIPNGVNTDKFSPIEDLVKEIKGFTVLTMRRLVPKNGVQYLVEAAPYVIQELPSVEFWIAGTGKLESHLRKRVVQLNIKKHFRFLGAISHDETMKYYKSADLVVFPSSAESTSLACLEAMAMKKAVIASALTPYQEMLGENERGILVKLFDRVSSDYNAPLTLPRDRLQLLAREIVKLCMNEDLRAELGQKARTFAVEHYDWSSIAAQTNSIYQKLVSY